jgi:hypothetical protein
VGGCRRCVLNSVVFTRVWWNPAGVTAATPAVTFVRLLPLPLFLRPFAGPGMADVAGGGRSSGRPAAPSRSRGRVGNGGGGRADRRRRPGPRRVLGDRPRRVCSLHQRLAGHRRRRVDPQ